MTAHDETCPPTVAPDGSTGANDADAALRTGIGLGLLSAIGYTLTNLALRQVAVPGDLGWAVWVTATKAVPAAIAGWLLIGRDLWLGRPALPPRRRVVPLIMAGLLMQYGGNLMFQWSLSLGGLAITVPLCFATLVTTGAWFGRFMVGDAITPKMLLSVAILGVSIVFLSAGAHEATTSMHETHTTTTVIIAVISACISGAAYGFNGVVIRRMTREMSVPASLVILSTTGVVVLGVHSLFSPGLERIAQTSAADWQALLAAGLFNAIAFFAVAGSLKRISVTYVNVLNASQNAMCAIAGVMLFGEPLTAALIAGCVLTIVGLLFVDHGGPRRRRKPGGGSSSSA